MLGEGEIRARKDLSLKPLVSFWSYRELLQSDIRGFLSDNFGEPADLHSDHQHTGPFTFLQYLSYKNKRGVRGDILDIVAFSLITGCLVTVVEGNHRPSLGIGSARTYWEARIGHDYSLKETLRTRDSGDEERDPTFVEALAVAVVLVGDGFGHFSCASEYSIRFYQSIRDYSLVLKYTINSNYYHQKISNIHP